MPSNCKVVQYADDTLLFTEHKDLMQCLQILEESCKLAYQYFNIHSLNLNAEKTELIVITKKNKSTTGGSVKVGGKIIETKKSAKYLGIMIDSHLSFEQKVKKILKKIACGIKPLSGIQKPFDIQTHLLHLQSLAILIILQYFYQE